MTTVQLLTSKYKNWRSSDSKMRKLFVSLDYYLRRRHFWTSIRHLSDKERFNAIYRHNLWNNEESLSGGGSTLRKTATLRTELPTLLRQYGIQAILDAGCGDFNWMKELRLGLGNVHYIGVDIVKDVITANQSRFGGPRTRFLELDISRDTLPTTDLILCRQVLFHLPFSAIFAALVNFKRSGSRYLLATHFPTTTANTDIPMSGMCRALNFEQPPFSFPPPTRSIAETPGECVSLWALQDIELPARTVSD